MQGPSTDKCRKIADIYLYTTLAGNTNVSVFLVFKSKLNETPVGSILQISVRHS